jgi:hypothetical protein
MRYRYVRKFASPTSRVWSLTRSQGSWCSHMCSRTRPHGAGLDVRGRSEIRTEPHQNGRSGTRRTGESELLIRWL